MADLGSIALLCAFALSSYAAVGSLVGAWKRLPSLIESARHAVYLAALSLVVATVGLVGAFLAHDFEVSYVAQHSNLAMPRGYTWVAFYAGNEGSLLFIATVLGLLCALAVAWAPNKLKDSMPHATAVMMLVLTFFLAVTTIMANPFDRLDFVPPDGQGINPLLVHFGMFIHPPMLMSGLVAVTIPFSLAAGALLAGKAADEWVDGGRVWGIASWVVLGVGLLLGSWWAYTILGWGGYWAWDPVENAALMPWLGLTAFIHSIMVQKRRGMFRMWNIALINISFALALFGMFINRGGPVPSVHSFGASDLGLVFLVFLGIGVVAPFGLFLWRYSSLKSAQNLESSLSREAAFLLNNLMLLGIAFVTMWGVIFPLISEIFQGQTITVGAPFYNQVNGPLLLALIFLMGVGPFLPWRRGSIRSLGRNVALPAAVSLMVVLVLALLGVTKAYALAGFGLCVFVALGVLLEWGRGTRTRMRSGDNPARAFGRLIVGNRPRYGGYVVHLSIVLVALGVVGSSFYGVQKDVVLAPGERTSIGGYEVEFVTTTFQAFPDRSESRFLLAAYKDGTPLTALEARRDFYPAFDISSTQAAIRSTPVEDLYVVPSSLQEDGSAGFRIFVNPMIWWIWVAGPVMVLGTVIALWPQRSPARAPAPSPVARRAVPSPVGSD